MTQVPFTVYFEVVPLRGQQRNPNRQPAAASSGVVRGRRAGRFDYVRSLQKLGNFVYDALDDIAGIQLAQPGGGQHAMYGNISSATSGTGVVPQFGNSPSRLMIEGFVDMDAFATESEQPNPVNMVFHGNEVLEGYMGQQPWRGPSGNPTADVEEEVSALKKTIENALIGVSDSLGMNPRIFRMDYKNIIWGDRGHHFPPSGF